MSALEVVQDAVVAAIAAGRASSTLLRCFRPLGVVAASLDALPGGQPHLALALPDDCCWWFQFEARPEPPYAIPGLAPADQAEVAALVLTRVLRRPGPRGQETVVRAALALIEAVAGVAVVFDQAEALLRRGAVPAIVVLLDDGGGVAVTVVEAGGLRTLTPTGLH